MRSKFSIVLLLALVAVAIYTRPSKDDFERYVVARQTTGDANVLQAGWDKVQAEQFLKDCTFTNRVLWVNVKNKDGVTVYTGALAHWYDWGKIKQGAQNARQKIENVKIDTK